jgi:hypothetical protein
MRVLLVTAMMTILAVSSSYACGHNTTAQSKSAVTIAQNETPLTTAPSGQIDGTQTGSTVDDTLVKKLATDVPQAK